MLRFVGEAGYRVVWCCWPVAVTVLALACGSRSSVSATHQGTVADNSSGGSTGEPGSTAVTSETSSSASSASLGSASIGSVTVGSTGVNAACDRDGDRHLTPICGGSDCNDEDSAIYPSASDLNTRAGALGEPVTLFADLAIHAVGAAMTVDGAGTAHVAYGANGLGYANNATGEFPTEQPDPDASGPASIVATRDGQVHVAYRAGAEARLATRTGGAWSIQRLGDMQDGPVALALDDVGSLHTAYATSAGIVYLKQTERGFSTVATLGSAAARPVELAVIDSNRPQLLFAETREPLGLHYAIGCAQGLCASQLTTGLPRAAMAVDTQGRAHVVYPSDSQDQDRRLTYRVRDNDARWSERRLTVESDAVHALDVTTLNNEIILHLLYTDAGFTARYAHGPPDALIEEMAAVENDDVDLTVENHGVVHVTSIEFTFSTSYFITYRNNRILEPDGVDQNCDGADGIDNDGDGDASLHSGGGDCNDFDATIQSLMGAAGATSAGCGNGGSE